MPRRLGEQFIYGRPEVVDTNSAGRSACHTVGDQDQRRDKCLRPRLNRRFFIFVLLLLKHRLHLIRVHFSGVRPSGAHGSLQVGTHNFARHDPCWHSHHCAVTRHVRDDKRISAHDHVVAYSHPTHHFASRAEIDIVADRRPPGSAYARDADALVNACNCGRCALARIKIPKNCG